MKKITLLLSFVACVLLAQGQTNLLVNPSFEAWTAGNPDGWTIPANSTHAGSLTWTQESTIKSNGSSSLKLVIGTTQNPGFQQVVPITAGKTYTVKMDYYVVSGDATDVRIWSSFKNATGFYAAANWTTAIAADANIQKKLQGSGSDIAAYFTIANGVWGTYTVDFVAPADATDFVFECRSYKSSTVLWDNMFFGEKTTGLLNPAINALSVSVIGKNLIVKNVANNSTVEIFNALGTKVLTTALVNGSTTLNLSKGLYIVRVGKSTTKITL
jgi:hypothetical protein